MARFGNYAYTHIGEGVKLAQVDVRDLVPFVELADDVCVDGLKPRVQFLGLEFFLAPVLKPYEAADKQQRVAEQPQKQAGRVGEPIR